MISEIEEFAAAIGAIRPEPGTDLHKAFSTVFKRPNYFLFDGRLLMIKISRSPRPFWGLNKAAIVFANTFDDYLVVLLTSESEGSYFRKAGVQNRVRNTQWCLSEAQGQYKINFPLPDANSFNSTEQLLRKLTTGH